MKLKELFEVIPTIEYVKIFSQKHILQFEGLVCEYIGSLDRPVFTLFAVVLRSDCAAIEIILDYEEDEND